MKVKLTRTKDNRFGVRIAVVISASRLVMCLRQLTADSIYAGSKLW